MENSIFEIKGYTKDYFVKGKLIGTIVLEKPDRQKYGLYGKQVEVLENDFLLKNKKIIKKVTEFFTEFLPICGRSKVNFFGMLKKNK